MPGDTANTKWLLIDSCGAVATLAVGVGEQALARAEINGRAFSAEWPRVLRGILREADFGLLDLAWIGIVHGPGSFTGVRVGLAAAKGLCEASGARLIAVSRLEVVASLGSAVAVLDAGRGEFYVRDGERETLRGRESLVAIVAGREVVTADDAVAALLPARVVVLHAVSALPLMLRRWSDETFDDAATLDANYVRGEQDIYSKKPVAFAEN